MIGPRPRSPIRTQLNCLRRSPMSISNSQQRAASSKHEKQSHSDPSLCFAASLSHAFIFILLYPLFNPLINASHPHLQLSSSRIRFARHSTWQPKLAAARPLVCITYQTLNVCSSMYVCMYNVTNKQPNTDRQSAYTPDILLYGHTSDHL